MKQSFLVRGKVQAIMFRQTFIRACLQRNIVAGASNSNADKSCVICSVECSVELYLKLKHDLQTRDTLNSWGAKVVLVEELSDYVSLSKHQVTTTNVDDFNWTAGVEFYL